MILPFLLCKTVFRAIIVRPRARRREMKNYLVIKN